MRFAMPTRGPTWFRPVAKRGPMRCGTASPWHCWTGDPRSPRSAMCSATAARGRQRRRTEVPPQGLIPRNRRRPQPYIYTDEEVAGIVASAARLPSRHGLRGTTCAALFGLLAVTGLRIGEALALDDGDVNTNEAALHVRHAKNGRNRTVPITPCTAERLACYRSLRDRTLWASDTPAFFRGERGQRIRRASAEHDFARVGQEIGLRERQPSGHRGTGPRLHDLRHYSRICLIPGLTPEAGGERARWSLVSGIITGCSGMPARRRRADIVRAACVKARSGPWPALSVSGRHADRCRWSRPIHG